MSFYGKVEDPHRWLSSPISLPHAPPATSYPMHIPVHHLYQSVSVPVQNNLPNISVSFPNSPGIVHKSPSRLSHNGTSASWPVFPADAQKRSNSITRRPVREAVLYTKTVMESPPKSPTVPPKMHLFAGGKSASKTVQAKLKEEDFPLPPVEWTLGGGGMSSTESSVSSSEAQSSITSEDESEEDLSRGSRSPHSELSSPVVMQSCAAAKDDCHVLSRNLKVLLKINA